MSNILFVAERFESHSGSMLRWKIECDSLSSPDVTCLALMISEIVGPFSRTVGVPTGGNRIAAALINHEEFGTGITLIVDDVLTTGASMEEFRRVVAKRYPEDQIKGVVLFARGRCPDWVTPLFQMPLPKTGIAGALPSWTNLSSAVATVMSNPEIRDGYPNGLSAVDVLGEIRKIAPDAFPLCSVIDVADELRSLYGPRS